jgi:uncharacterized cofD-like protein
LEPDNPPAFPDAIKSILTADMIVVGPGSLYTSIMPNLLVPDIAEAIRASKALKLFICNLATQQGETDGYNCRSHLLALEEHSADNMFDLIVVNNNYSGNLPKNVDWVESSPELVEEYPIYGSDLVDTLHPWRHDSKKLASAVLDLYQERTGPLVE